jgi:hypothetical protein
MLDFILNESNVNMVITRAAIVLPLGCIAFYVILRRRLATQPEVKVWLAVIGVLGPLILVLWHVYNLIENAYGLDSVRALVLNFILFVAVGVAFGLLVRVWRRRMIAKMPEAPSSSQQGNKDSTGN